MRKFYVNELDDYYQVFTTEHDGSITTDTYTKEEIYKLLNAIMNCLVYRD